MNISHTLKTIKEFKGNNLEQKLHELKISIVQDKTLPDLTVIYESALEIKKLTAQIDEIVHATGIIKCLPEILEKGEVVRDLSLAAGAGGEGIDLVTNKRIAEFKFARWNIKGNGMRKRHVFADLVNLYLHPTPLKKELYVFNSERVDSFFNSKVATWKNVLSKSGGLASRLEEHLQKIGVSGTHLKNVYTISNVTLIDIDDILK